MSDDVDRAREAAEETGDQMRGEPWRRMLTRVEAMEKANAFLRDEGMPDVAASATPNPNQHLWMVGHHNPMHPEELIIGGGPLIVPTVGPAYWAAGSIPPWPEDVGLEEPELWRFERGDDLFPIGWQHQLAGEFDKQYWGKLLDHIAEDRQVRDVYPPPSRSFAAFRLTPFEDVKVVILGQDPYPNAGQANGLAFSVQSSVAKLPPSLRSIHRELETDVGVSPPGHGNLEGWAEQGVLLLNAALTVRAGSKEDREAHRKWRWRRQGWETFTDAVITAVSSKSDRVVFILWGRDARQKETLIELPPHAVIASAHPSPLSAYRGFFGSRPFSRANDLLREAGRDEIDWSHLPPQ